MLQNNNQAAVKRISSRTLKQNMVRNIFAVLAIILTTFMFTAVFSIGYSVVENVSVMEIRQQGTKAVITLKCPSDKQIGQAKGAESLLAAGIRIPAGRASDLQKKAAVVLDYYDKAEFEENFTPSISDIEGAYPSGEKDIMVSLAGLQALGIEAPREGMEIRLVKDSVECVFYLSGWFTDYNMGKQEFQGFVSEAYVQSLGLTIEKNGRLCLSAQRGKQRELIEELSLLVSLRKGQEWEINYDVEEEYGDRAGSLLAVVAFLGVIIIISGYLLIYNIMYISVTKDIRFYGLLKTIGTSPAQIRKIVKRQVSKLCIIGIPVGMLAGTVLSFALIPLAVRMYAGRNRGALPGDIRFSPLIYVGTVLFAILTVSLSCRKPARLAGRVSPVEALKYNGKGAGVRLKQRNTTNGGKLPKMAYRNVFREKKRAALVFASLFMGAMAFLAVRTFINAVRWENYVTSYLPYSICVDMNTGHPENSKQAKDTREAKKLAADMKKIEGITSIHENRLSNTVTIKFDRELFAPFLEQEGLPEGERERLTELYENPDPEYPDGLYAAPVISVDSEMMRKYNLRARQKIDIGRFEQGEVCLVGYVDTIKQSEQMLGKTITLTDTESGKTIHLEIGACPTQEGHSGIAVGFQWMLGGSPECILVSDKVLDSLCDKTAVANIVADCEEEAEGRIARQLDRLVESNRAVSDVKIRSRLAKEFHSMMNSINIMGGGLSLILILIGVINFINVMLTGVFSRRVELAVLESIGMTKRQIKRMLIYEGGFYSAITLALLFTLGSVMIYAVKGWVMEAVDYAVFQYPAAEGALLAVLLIIICLAVPSIMYRTLSRESVTQRLRSGE